MSPVRWSGDTRGRGVSDASSSLPALERLRKALRREDWVAEQPEAHLLPHIVASCEAGSSPWTLLNTAVEHAVLVVTLAWQRQSRDASLRRDAMGLIGAFAESNTFVHQVKSGGDWVFEVTTGQLEGDASYAPHGHLVRLVVRPSPENP